MNDDAEERDFASPPCAMADFPLPLPPAAVPQMRREQRARLLAERQAIPAEERARLADGVAEGLDRLLGDVTGRVISAYWPIKAELDLRDWMTRAQARGARIALPLVVAKAQPLRFREWWPGCGMERGVWNILQPAGTPELTPDIALAPLVGFDASGYRLGYGGGFFDRTLAALGPGARAIGVGIASARMPTIHPQPHDIPMDAIVTGPDPVLIRGWQA